MRLTKIHHACLIVATDTTRVLLDPGLLGPRPSLDGVDAVLITHKHVDHLDPELVHRALGRHIPVWVPPDTVADLTGVGDGLHEAVAGQHLAVGDLTVTVTGDRHAQIHPERPGPDNRAYLFGRGLLVTGDEHVVPPHPIDTLVTPIDAPWLRATDLIRYVRTTRPTRVIGVHDGLLNADGLAVAGQVAASLVDGTTQHSSVVDDAESVIVS